RRVAHLDLVGPAAPFHLADHNLAAIGESHPLVAVKLEIADAVELGIVRDAGRAVAESNLGPQVDVDLDAAVGARAAVGLAQAPLVEGERPFDLGPDRPRRADGCRVAGEQAGEAGADRDNENCGSQAPHGVTYRSSSTS